MTTLLLRALLRSSPGYAPSPLYRGASPVYPQPVRRQSRTRTWVRASALCLALLLAGSRAAVRLVLLLCEQTGRAAPALFFCAVLLGGFQLVQQFFVWADQPLSRLSLGTEATQLGSLQVQQKLAPLLSEGGFFTLDLDGARRELESLPLVAAASLHRRWPGQLSVQLQMHQPLARWGEQGLLVEGGQVLAGGAAQYAHLPQLVGPAGSSAELLQHYQEFGALLRPLGVAITRLEKRERGSWFLNAAAPNGAAAFEIALGRGELAEKMQRFVQLYGGPLKAHPERVVRVDLRHRGGLAVAFAPEGKTLEATQETQ